MAQHSTGSGVPSIGQLPTTRQPFQNFRRGTGELVDPNEIRNRRRAQNKQATKNFADAIAARPPAGPVGRSGRGGPQLPPPPLPQPPEAPISPMPPGEPGGGGGVAPGLDPGTQPSLDSLSGLAAAGQIQPGQAIELPSGGPLGRQLGRRTPNSPSVNALSRAGGRIF